MTLEQFLSETPANPLDENSPWLTWFRADLSKEEKLAKIAQAGALPYASVAGLEENERLRDHDSIGFVDQLVVVTLHQQPEVVNGVKRTPDDRTIYALYERILLAPRVVSAAGRNRHFLGLERSPTQQPPRGDAETGGLYAHLSFRLRFTRA